MNLFIRLLGLLLCGLLCESVKTLGKVQAGCSAVWVPAAFCIAFCFSLSRLFASGGGERAGSRKLNSTKSPGGKKVKAHPRHIKRHTISFVQRYDIKWRDEAAEAKHRKKILVWWLFKLKILHNARLMLKRHTGKAKKRIGKSRLENLMKASRLLLLSQFYFRGNWKRLRARQPEHSFRH